MSWSAFKATLLPAMQSHAFGNNMAGFSCFECCAGAGGCLNAGGGDLG